MKSPIILLGAGGHAKVLHGILELNAERISDVVVAADETCDQTFYGTSVTVGDEYVLSLPAEKFYLVNGLGSVKVEQRRRRIYEYFKMEGYHFATVVHPSAIVSNDVVLAEGSQLMAGAVVQAGSSIGKNVIINSGAVVDHDCKIGDHVHVAPGATISGEVSVGEGSHIGTGATIIQGINVGRCSLVAAGAVVIRNVPDNTTVFGVPASERLN